MSHNIDNAGKGSVDEKQEGRLYALLSFSYGRVMPVNTYAIERLSLLMSGPFSLSTGLYPPRVCYGAVSYTHLDVYKRQ